MNNELTNAIVKHLFTGLGIYGEVPVSLRHQLFLTDQQIAFDDENDEAKMAPVWAGETKIENKKFSFIYTSLVMKDFPTEDFLVVKLDDNPGYGCYAALVDLNDLAGGFENKLDVQDGFIAVQLKSQSWIPANIYLQATFLAGMEQLKDLASRYEKSSKLEEMFGLLKDFITYREGISNDRSSQI
jgi:hypothetical protein